MDPIPERDLRVFRENTILALTRAPQRASAWRAQVEEALATAQAAGATEHAAFFQALLALLDGRAPALPPDHPYAAEVARIQRAVAGIPPQPAEAETLSPDELDVIVRNTLGVLSVARERRGEWRAQLEQALADARTQGEAWRPEAELFQALLALLGGEAPVLPADHAYAPTLERIQRALAPQASAPEPKPERAARGLRENQLEAIISNTIAVLTSDPDQRDAWRARMAEAHEQALQAKLPLDAAFFGALVELLSASHWPPGSRGAPTLPAEHAYAEALARIEKGIVAAPPAGEGPEGGSLRGYTIVMPGVVVDAVQAYAAAPDWRAARAVVEEHALALIRPEAEELLEGMAAQAQMAGRAQEAERLAERLAVLRACKLAGIEATFQRLG